MVQHKPRDNDEDTSPKPYQRSRLGDKSCYTITITSQSGLRFTEGEILPEN